MAGKRPLAKKGAISVHFPEADFARSTPERMGIESRAILAVLDAIVREQKDIHSMLVLRGGVLVHEQYFAPYTREMQHDMFSCSKTFTSMLIGIAQGKGLLRLEERVCSFFPEIPVEHPSANLDAMTIRDLLVMGTGHAEDVSGVVMRPDQPDWARVFLNQPVEYVPGTHFAYNTAATYMLSAILTKVTGRTALELAREWIFSRIGIEGASWESCPRGISLGGTGLRVRPVDMARFGMLIANEGVWRGERVVPAEYIREARTAQIDNRGKNPDPNWNAGYGYQMWQCSFGPFRADGMGGQFIVIDLERDLVVVFTSALGADIGVPLKYIENILLPGVHAEALPEDATAQAALLRRARELADPAPSAAPEGMPWGEYALEENPLGIARLGWSQDEISLERQGAVLRAPYRWGAPVVTSLPVEQAGALGAHAPELAVTGLVGSTPCVRVNAVGSPFTLYIALEAGEEGLDAVLRHTVWGSARVRVRKL